MAPKKISGYRTLRNACAKYELARQIQDDMCTYHKGTCVASSICNPAGVGGRQVRINTLKLDVLREVCGISQCLVVRQESQVFRAEIRDGYTTSVVAVLQDDTQPAGRFGKLIDDAFLEEWQPADSGRFPGTEDYDGAAGFIVAGVEPVPERECVVRVRFVPRLVVKVVNRHLEGMFGILGLSGGDTRILRGFSLRLLSNSRLREPSRL